MGNYILETSLGKTFDGVSRQAKELATEHGITVEFDFNEIKCLVDYFTDLKLLHRDYMNASIMDWKVVGPDCLSDYEPEVSEELDRRNKQRDEEYIIQISEWKEKEEREKQAFEEKVKGIELDLKNPEGWQHVVEINSDPYGKCTVDYAEGWAKLMQIEISKGKTIEECASDASFGLDFLGITGFMYGCAVGILSQYWVHGEELRVWHNNEYGVKGNGVVNPAVMTLNIPTDEEDTV